MSDVVSLHQDAAKGPHAVTPTVRDIHHTLSLCEHQGFLGAVVGEPGTGKTTAIEAYAAASEGAKVVRMNRATSALQPVLERICHAVALHVPKNAGAGRLLNVAIRAILDEEPGGEFTNLLIIDEAQYLEDAALEGMRDLYDAINRACGIVLVGNDLLPARWTDSKKKSSTLFRQLRARMLPPLEVTMPDKDDLHALCAHHAITNTDGCALIERAAARPGRLHNVDRLLRMATQLAGDGTLTGQSFRDAARLTGVSS